MFAVTQGWRLALYGGYGYFRHIYLPENVTYHLGYESTRSRFYVRSLEECPDRVVQTLAHHLRGRKQDGTHAFQVSSA